MNVAAYPGRAPAHARILHESGWSITDIQRLLEEEFERRPTWVTVKCWVDPVYAEKRRREMRPYQRAHEMRKRGRRPSRRVTAEFKRERMQELYDRRVSLRAIGQVCAVWFGEELSAGRVAKLLGLRA